MSFVRPKMIRWQGQLLLTLLLAACAPPQPAALPTVLPEIAEASQLPMNLAPGPLAHSTEPLPAAARSLPRLAPPSINELPELQDSPPEPPSLLPAPGLLALDAARSMVGTRYHFGGRDPRGFDCSGLVQYAFNSVGIALPHSSGEIFKHSRPIDQNELQPGDLVFFAIRKNRISHVGIYDHDGLFIHSPSSGKGVGYANLEDEYWRKRLVAVGRF